jgi:hypothetical protein
MVWNSRFLFQSWATGAAWNNQSSFTGRSCRGTTWERAKLEPAEAPYAWQAWSCQWRAAEPGAHELCCRAEDEAGDIQPIEQHWTARGMGNNTMHRVTVQVV